MSITHTREAIICNCALDKRPVPKIVAEAAPGTLFASGFTFFTNKSTGAITAGTASLHKLGEEPKPANLDGITIKTLVAPEDEEFVPFETVATPELMRAERARMAAWFPYASQMASRTEVKCDCPLSPRQRRFQDLLARGYSVDEAKAQLDHIELEEPDAQDGKKDEPESK